MGAARAGVPITYRDFMHYCRTEDAYDASADCKALAESLIDLAFADTCECFEG
jgi:hypothetical protein